RQAIITLWTRPAHMGLHKQPLDPRTNRSNESVQLATRHSLASRLRRRLDADREPFDSWTLVQDGFEAFFRVMRGPSRGEVTTILAMRYELAQQIGVAIPGVYDQTSLKVIGAKFGAVMPSPDVPDRMTGGVRLAVLTFSLAGQILARPDASASEPSDTSDRQPVPSDTQSHEAVTQPAADVPKQNDESD